ncbi:MAG: PBP1A family penicillin-binding protein [Oscillatoriales cyanobacterium RM2_1_1]|nr:PBP1A family penicillin-binding protein [Oscillatoriales cyanobacterium SM2_3_0]NJO47021.1 PBP1A family penicillin-binding protein [Oscillatoriales cyanobacterium RM2_1_1]
MSSTPPPQKSKTLLGAITQAVQAWNPKVSFSKLAVKANARVPEICVQNPESNTADSYPLLGDRYILGRSSKSCDIVVRNPVVSQVHLSLLRDRPQKGLFGVHQSQQFFIQDEQSTNGLYLGRRRINTLPLRHGDLITLGPIELANGVQLRYTNPPPWYKRVLQYGFWGITGITGLSALVVLMEWQKIPVRPLPPQSQGPVVVYSKDGESLRPLPDTQAVSLDAETLADVSKYLPKAVIASEDSRFYWHMGLDPIGIVRALVTNLRGGEIREGGSTLSQQLARNLFRDYVGTEDSAGRKLREALVALKLETVYSKNQLLLTYLNRVFLGSDLYGFENAARFYFAKPAKELTLSEAATLAGILPAPNTFNPIRDYQKAVAYRNRVISRMQSLKMIGEDEANRARRSRIEINPAARELFQSTMAPYFYDYVFMEIEQLLGDQVAREGNFIVETSLDPQFQKVAESSLRNTINAVGVQDNFSQGAMVTLDSRSGEVLSMVGGVDYETNQFNRATQAQRQPGSTFKIFTYGAALEAGVSPDQTYSCSALNWQNQEFQGCERSGTGAIDMYQGMAQSENVIALRIAQEVGLDAVVQIARKLGIQSPLQETPGLVLGQSEANLLEMTGAFGILANGGQYHSPHAVRLIRDRGDCSDTSDQPDPNTCRIIYSYERENANSKPVLKSSVVSTMTQLLSGVVRSGTGQNAFMGLGEVGKTGTTDFNVDLWFIGYLSDYTTGVWLGNDDNSPTNGSSGDAARLWKDYMGQIAR